MKIGMTALILAGMIGSGWLLTQTTWANDAADKPAWAMFESKRNGFGIEMPQAPVQTQTHQDSFIGHITNHLFKAAVGDAHFTVDVSDLPRFAVDFAGADTIYEHAKGALLKKTLSKMVSFDDLQINGHAGRRLVFAPPPVPGKPKMTGQAYLLLVGTRFYVIDTITPTDGGQTDAQRFLGSFKLIAP